MANDKADFKTYLDGTPFPGKIGRSYTDPDCKQAFPVAKPAPAGAPNVLYIVLDDVGFGWCSPFGGLVDTPNITKLADHGLRFTNFHTTSICAPTRACLLTGRNHHSVGMGILPEMVSGYPGYNANLPRDKAAIGAILRREGYNTFAVGKWHNTPTNQVGPNGPFDRWPTGELYGFEHFYGYMECEMDQYFPELYRDTHPVDPPAVPDDEGRGYHLSEDLVDNAITMIAKQQAVQGNEGEKPWLMFLAFGAGHAPHHVTEEWVAPYTKSEVFQKGWDVYRETVLAKQKKMGIMPSTAELAPMKEVGPWDELSSDQKKLFARMAEVYAGFLSHTDAQIGRLIEFLRESRQLDNTLIFVFLGDNGASGEGTPTGLFNEIATGNEFYEFETVDENLKRLDRFGKPRSYNHYPAGWAYAGNTPFALCKQYVHFGGIRNPMVVHWPKGIKVKPGGERRTQFHHVIDVVPTILECIGDEGLTAPLSLDGVTQAPIEGTSMKYAFSSASAEEQHTAQYFEMMGNRAIIRRGWKAVTWHGDRLPWENQCKDPGEFDRDHWELYALEGCSLSWTDESGKAWSFHYEADPTECHDLSMKIKAGGPEGAALAQKLDELVTSWWEEAGRYDVLPLDDRFQDRFSSPVPSPTHFTFYAGTTRVPEGVWPNVKSRSWKLTATIEVDVGAEGLICSQGGCTGGWALYVQGGRPHFYYNFLGEEVTDVAVKSPLTRGKHTIHFELEHEKPTKESCGGAGTATLWVDSEPVGDRASKRIPRTAKLMIGTFDVGCEKGSPIIPARYVPCELPFNGKIVRVDIDLADDQHELAGHARLAGMLARQ